MHVLHRLAVLSLFWSLMGGSAQALSVEIANNSSYPILGVAMQGRTSDGSIMSAFSAFKGYPGSSVRQDVGNIRTLTALRIDYGRCRITVKNPAALKNAETVQLTLRTHPENRTPTLTTGNGKELDLDIQDLRFTEHTPGVLDFMTLVRADGRGDVEKLLNRSAPNDSHFGDVVLPVRIGDTVWTGVLTFSSAEDDARLMSVRLLHEANGETIGSALPELMQEMHLRPLYLQMPDQTIIRYYDAGDRNAAHSKEEDCEQFCSIVSDDTIFASEHNEDMKLVGLLATEKTFADCMAQSKNATESAPGISLERSNADLVDITFVKDMSGQVMLMLMP
ncbi:MAG: hypothetical protein K5657_02875 [Desulfovibrio sp.]|nr:hypothetical protein [Desulfovibrio sp.]